MSRKVRNLPRFLFRSQNLTSSGVGASDIGGGGAFRAWDRGCIGNSQHVLILCSTCGSLSCMTGPLFGVNVGEYSSSMENLAITQKQQEVAVAK